MVPEPTRDSLRGAWVGMAIGDAIGGVHGGAPRARPDAAWRDLPAGGPHRLPAGVFGTWTSLALATAEAVVECGCVDATAVRTAVGRWWREGRWCPLGHALPVAPATRAWLGAWGVVPPDDDGPTGTPHDALALAVPIAQYLRRERSAAGAAVVDVLTGVEPSAVAAGRELAHRIVGAAGANAAVPEPSSAEALVATAQAIADGAESYEAALRAVAATPGADATLGALVGLLVGGRVGLRAIPARWRAQVAWGVELVAIADRLGDGPAAPPAPLDHPWRTWSRAPAPVRER